MMNIFKARWFTAVGCLLLGILLILGIRFATYNPEKVHYHANFAVYINGQRELFKGPQYYEEDSLCAVATTVTPILRAHMHDSINSVVHVHDHAVTWGDFFMNIGWSVGQNFVERPDGTMYLEHDSDKLSIILNGKDYTDIGNVATMLIKDQDRLLVSFGDISSADLTKEYATVPSTAHHYDITPDPASCSGSEPVTLRDRLTHLL